MSTPQLTEAVEGRQSPDADHTAPTRPAAPENKLDYSAYTEKTRTCNDAPLQPWRIAVLAHAGKMYAVLERKKLQFDLLDWFEDARVGAVMRGEKIVPESEFWFHLYRQSIGAIQQHFGNLPVHVSDAMPPGKVHIVFGEKPNKQQEKPLPSPVAVKAPNKKKRIFKQRS